MNNPFDELARGLAQSVTRRGALKKFGVGLAGVVLASLGLVRGADLYVDASAAPGGNGSGVAPYARITDAVARARQLRQSATIQASERIVIHVAAGNYTGTFGHTPVDNNAKKEVLPILLNVPNLTLTGATVLERDASGLPTGLTKNPQTRLTSSETGDGAHQALLLICRTTDGAAGDGVTVAGFTFDEFPSGLGVVVDRVADFALVDNAFVHTGIGTIARLSSGIVEGNYYLNSSSVGPGIGGGSRNHPARVTLSRNRSTGAFGGADIRGEPSLRALDLGANTLQLEPLQLVFDRNQPKDLKNLPDTLDVVVQDNDFSGNLYTGLWCFFYSSNPLFGYSTKDASQPKTAVVRATINGNTFTGNGDYGFVVEAGGVRRNNPRTELVSFTGAAQGNDIEGNGRSGVLFGFVSADVSLGAATLQDFKYVEQSTYSVNDVDGGLAGFDFDNPRTDPFSGTVLNNALIVNGMTIPPGVKITSLKK
jgi:hypothetical protein